MQISDKTVELFYPAACASTAVRRIHTAIKAFSKDSYLKILLRIFLSKVYKSMGTQKIENLPHHRFSGHFL